MVERVVWDHEAAGSKPVTRTRKPAEIARFQWVFHENCLIFSKSYSLIIAAQELNYDDTIVLKVFPLVLSPCVFTLIFRNHVAEASVLLEYIVYLIIMNRFDHCVILLAYYAPSKLWSKANRASLISKTL